LDSHRAPEGKGFIQRRFRRTQVCDLGAGARFAAKVVPGGSENTLTAEGAEKIRGVR
jgi:hypothetical protein